MNRPVLATFGPYLLVYYVTLARSLGVLLVTEDGKIKRNCPDVARSLEAFVGLPGDRPGMVREKRAVYRTRPKPSR